MKKRLLTVLLAVCLVLALGTVSALAADTLPDPVGDVITLEDNVTMQASAINRSTTNRIPPTTCTGLGSPINTNPGNFSPYVYFRYDCQIAGPITPIQMIHRNT